MKKPLLIVITGSPASGKTTLSHLLAKEIKCPLLSRDELKEGYINSTGIPHNEAGAQVDKHIYEFFFQAIDLFVSGGISTIVEAAFQHKLWAPKLNALLDKADVKIIICRSSVETAKARFMERFIKDADREKFHGDNLSTAGEKIGTLIERYEPVNMNVPVLMVDTTSDYQPGLEQIVQFLTFEPRQ